MLQGLITIGKEVGYTGLWILFISVLSLYLVSEMLRLRRKRTTDTHKAIQATLRLVKEITKSNISDEHYQRLTEAALREIDGRNGPNWEPTRLSSPVPNLLKMPTLCGLIAAGVIFSVQMYVLWDQVSGPLGFRTRKIVAVSFVLHFLIGATSAFIVSQNSSWIMQMGASIIAVTTVYIVFGSLIVYIPF